MNKPTKHLSIIAMAVLATFQSQADVRINGFANLSAGVTNEDVDLFGYTEDIDFSSGSLFALQVAGDIGDKLTATAQIVARGNDDYSAVFEWAYLTYEMSENSVITAGRFRLPVFRYSASLDVGYSYHWITAPQTVYDVAFNNLNGVRYDYSNYSGDFEYLLQFSYGNYEDDVAGGVNTGSNVVLTSFEGTYNSFKGRVVWGRGDNVFTQPVLDQNIAGLAAVSPGLADDLAIDDDPGEFLGFGIEYDNFDWFVAAEWTEVDIEDSFSPKDTAYYVTAGVRTGKWTPHLTFQARDGRGDIKFLDRVAQLPAEIQPTIGGAVTGLQALFFEDYTMTTVGVRYDWSTSIALKGEVTKYDNKIEPLINPDDPIDTTLVNVSVNYVF
jgi:hypothetical protein